MICAQLLTGIGFHDYPGFTRCGWSVALARSGQRENCWVVFASPVVVAVAGEDEVAFGAGDGDVEEEMGVQALLSLIISIVGGTPTLLEAGFTAVQGHAPRIARLIAARWAGVVPQQPPAMRTPASNRRLAVTAISSGVAR